MRFFCTNEPGGTEVHETTMSWVWPGVQRVNGHYWGFPPT